MPTEDEKIVNEVAAKFEALADSFQHEADLIRARKFSECQWSLYEQGIMSSDMLEALWEAAMRHDKTVAK